MVLTKKYWILISVVILAVLLGGSLIYFGWTKQKSEPALEQIAPESIRAVIIPSLLEPEEVMEQFVPYIPPWGEKITQKDPFWATYLGILYPHKGFIKGFGTAWYVGQPWIKKDGTVIESPDEVYRFTLEVMVLKYEKPEFAREDYDRASVERAFGDSVLEDVKLKTKLGIPPILKERPRPDMINIKLEQCQEYLLHSNNFIIYIFGLKEAAHDAIIRVIDQYTVE